MRIAVSLLNFRPGRIGGTETYIRQLVANLDLCAVAEDDEIVLLTDRRVASEFGQSNVAVLDDSPRTVERSRFLEATTPYRARRAERLLERVDPDVVLFPQQSMFPKFVGPPSVLVVHDLYHVALPGNLTPIQRICRGRSYARSIDRADHVIAISNVTRRQLIAHYDLADRSSRIHTVHHGSMPTVVGRTFAQRHVLDTPFVYYPAVTHPHKNHLELFHTVHRLRREGAFPYRLLLTGAQTGHWRSLRRTVRRLGLDDCVVHLGFVPFEFVVAAYERAEAVLFPSSYEGFGLPVVEAAAFGRKVITSNLEIFAELGVPPESRIDFGDPAALRNALECGGPTTLSCPLPTWARVAERTLAILRNAANPCIALPPPPANPDLARVA